MKKWNFWKVKHTQNEPDELDKLLYEYMPKYEQELMAELEKNIDYDYQFSDNYKRKMKRLIRKERFMVLMRILKRVGVCAAALLLIFCVSMYWGVTHSKAGWVKLYETIKTFWEDSFLYSYFSDNDEELPISYEPTYIPEGYEFVRMVENARMRVFIYEKDDKQLKLQQLIIRNTGETVIDSEFVKKELMQVHGMEIALFYYADGDVCSYYEYLDSTFLISASELIQDEVIKIYKGWIQQ